MHEQPIILFDGTCNFCNGTVNFVIRRDKGSVIKFAPLQSTQGQQILQRHQLPMDDLSSFLFIEAGKPFSKSTAALKVCRYLSGLWPLFYSFIIVPKFIRDGLYNWIAKNRYKWFGRQETCMIPSPDVKKRFL